MWYINQHPVSVLFFFLCFVFCFLSLPLRWYIFFYIIKSCHTGLEFNMACLDTLGSQLITTLLVPQEVFLLQHRVLWEYGKIAVGPDFIHTFPSVMIIAALFIFSRRELNFQISNKILDTIIQVNTSIPCFNCTVIDGIFINVYIYISRLSSIGSSSMLDSGTGWFFRE